MRSKVTVKTLVCWAVTFSVDGTYIFKMEFIVLNGDIKYSLKISLMSSVIQRVRPNHFSPNHFSKELLKYIFMKFNFINIYVSNFLLKLLGLTL